MRADDKPLLHLFFRRPGQRSAYLKFFRAKQGISEGDLVQFIEVDFRNDFALLAVLRERGIEKIIGVGKYNAIRAGNEPARKAEMVVAVADEHQGRGIGTLLLEHLVQIGRSHGITEFQVNVPGENEGMLRVFADSGFQITHSADGDITHLTFPTEQTEAAEEAHLRRERHAAAQSIRAILNPRSVAIVGASRQAGTIGVHWITNMPLPQSILWVGQMLNGLAVLTLIPFAVRLGKNQWAGIITILIAGVLSPMPMFYTNWGRYTQLAGQVILPISIWLVWSFLLISENKERFSSNLDHDDTTKQKTLHRFSSFIPDIDRRLYSLSVITLSGLALTHYRILIFAVLFFPAALFFQLHRKQMMAFLIRTILLGMGAGLIFLPWFIHIFKGEILTIVAYQLTTAPAQPFSSSVQVNPIGNLFTYLPAVLWLLLPLTIGWGLWMRNKSVAIFSLWWFFIVLAANPNWIGIPGVGSLDAFTYFIAAYIPTSILLGASAGWGIDTLQYQFTMERVKGRSDTVYVQLASPPGVR